MLKIFQEKIDIMGEKQGDLDSLKKMKEEILELKMFCFNFKIIDGINSRIDKIIERIIKFEDRLVKIIEIEGEKEGGFKILIRVLICVIVLNDLIYL